MVGTTEYAVPLGNLIDVEEELKKLEADLAYEEGFLKSVQKKLSNENFVNKAPAKVIEMERKKQDADSSYAPILKTSIITARNAPAHERVVTTLKEWNINVDQVFFLGGIEKARILNILKPHIFFDDQMIHLEQLENVPAVHIPFGVANRPQEKMMKVDYAKQKSLCEKIKDIVIKK